MPVILIAFVSYIGGVVTSYAIDNMSYKTTAKTKGEYRVSGHGVLK